MKIDRSKGTSGASGTKKSSSSGNADGADFSQYVQSGASETASASATQSIASLDALLAAQEVEDPTKKAAKKRIIFRADGILDKLENIRIKMLCGNLTVGHMIDVADVVASHRDKIDDPQLTAIMDEIDLRAQVEIAKMRAAMDTN
ncbi:MAG: flagellar assembly protein FliX [Alphaproteobacteria bacterium]